MSALKWLLASGNAGKLREMRQILVDFPISLVGLDELGIAPHAPETGSSFLENAIQKAEFYQARAGLPVVADDSGLEVDALDGAPGINSARFGGLETHAEKRAYLLELMRDVEPQLRTARFVCAAVYYDGRMLRQAQATMEGFIGFEDRGDHGFGYDPIFHLTWQGPTSAQIDPQEKNRVSHRGQAFIMLARQVLET